MHEEEYKKMINERIGRAARAGLMQAEDEKDPLPAQSFTDEKISPNAYIEDKDAHFSDEKAFVQWMKAIKRKHLRQKRQRYAFVAAMLVCALLTADLLQDTSFSQQIFAGNSPRDNVEVNGGSIVIGGDGNEHVGTWVATFHNYEAIPEQYKEEIIQFNKMPDGYELKEIQLKRNLDVFNIRIKYTNRDSLVQIKEEKLEGDGTDVMILNGYQESETYQNIETFKKQVDGFRMHAFVYKEKLITVIFEDTSEKEGDSECLQNMIDSVLGIG
ncbi:MAG: hypothetical protein HFE73_01980 [Firmicutes bacterium]|nr:hypothetical protein [Bacillota bacterium]